jgi:hypothetical protein
MMFLICMSLHISISDFPQFFPTLNKTRKSPKMDNAREQLAPPGARLDVPVLWLSTIGMVMPAFTQRGRVR